MNKILKNVDRQITGMAGEFLVLGKLFKLGYQASFTFGNAKAVDLFVYNEKNDKEYCVQVKTLRKKNCFLLKKESVKDNHVYVFVILNDPNEFEEYFIISGRRLLSNINHYWGSSYIDNGRENKMPAVNYGPIKEHRNAWDEFEK